MNDLILIMTQTEDGRVLSRLTLEYPGLTNAEANGINLGFVDALATKAAEFAGMKANGQPSFSEA